MSKGQIYIVFYIRCIGVCIQALPPVLYTLRIQQRKHSEHKQTSAIGSCDKHITLLL